MNAKQSTIDSFLKKTFINKDKQIREYFTNGFWSSPKFMEGMYLKYDKHIFIPLEVREKGK